MLDVKTKQSASILVNLVGCISMKTKEYSVNRDYERCLYQALSGYTKDITIEFSPKNNSNSEAKTIEETI